ncbi:hypothetical protein [Streptomyces sp. NBC_01361]|uniref:hypothetical protein n=1 Tax=Streptomyces sp. NBC_01361 TaxID=2903838 RepID=UPI002E33DE8B|nr:hypothetical protein [Streptomyces sp. NBC_01361]
MVRITRPQLAVRLVDAVAAGLVLQTPAPVIARMLGYHDDTTAQLAAEAGGTWRHYASGDHTR